MKKYLWMMIMLLLTAPGLCACGGSEQEQEPFPAGQEETLPEAEPEEMSKNVQMVDAEPELSLHRQDSGEVQYVMMEEYLKGVVAAEIGDKFPAEALKAQAIVARSMTLAKLEYEGGTRDVHNTDVSDDHTEFQAYDAAAVTEDISQAVEDTRGIVLLSDGNYAYTLFSSVSEGMTASPEEGFPELADIVGGYIQPVPTDGIKNAPEKYRAWEVRVPLSRVKEIMHIDAATAIETIEIAERGPSERVLQISVNGGAYTISGVDFRQAVGFDTLYSTLIHTMTIEGDELALTGAGWGHGCGMEQWGAYTMANEGAAAMTILAHYYPGTAWVQLYE